MERFDNIDIFFIAIIGAYFITLACIILSFIIIGIKKLIKNIKEKNLKPVLPIIEQTIQIPQEEIKSFKAKKDKNKKPKLTHEKTKETKVKRKPIKENIPVLPRRKLSEIAIIQKLFMKKVPPKIKIEEDKTSIKLETTVLSDKVHVNTSKYNTGETLEKQKSALENVIEQINKADNKEVLEKKKVEEKALSEIIVNITKEDKEKKADISLVEKTESETKIKKDATPSDKTIVAKDNSKTKLSNDNKDKVNKEKETITTNSGSYKTKNNTNKGNSHKSNSKNTNTKQKNINTKKSNKNNTKKKKTNSNKKKSTNTKGKKNTKKKSIKRKKS